MDSFQFLLNGEKIAKMYQESKNELEKKALVMKIFTGVYFNLTKLVFFAKDEDSVSDFSLFFYDKIPTLLDKYDPKKASFKTYITASMQWAFRSFYYEKTRSKTREEVLELEEKELIDINNKYLEPKFHQHIFAEEEKIPYSKNTKKIKNLKFTKGFYSSLSMKKRYIFLLACKASLFLDEDLVRKIADEIELPFTEFKNLIEKLKQRSSTKQRNINKIIMRRNIHYIKMKVSEKILNSSFDQNSKLYKRAKISHKFSYTSWKNAKYKNARLIKSPSDKIIGEFLNISRGTVTRNIDKALKELYN